MFHSYHSGYKVPPSTADVINTSQYDEVEMSENPAYVPVATTVEYEKVYIWRKRNLPLVVAWNSGLSLTSINWLQLACNISTNCSNEVLWNEHFISSI